MKLLDILDRDGENRDDAVLAVADALLEKYRDAFEALAK